MEQVTFIKGNKNPFNIKKISSISSEKRKRRKKYFEILYKIVHEKNPFRRLILKKENSKILKKFRNNII